jgi:hypothetical protein
MELQALRFAPGWSSRDENTLAAVEYWSSPTARQFVNSFRMVSLKVADDGSFVSVERAPAGVYEFFAVAKKASMHRIITIRPEDEQLPYFDLGAIELR